MNRKVFYLILVPVLVAVVCLVMAIAGSRTSRKHGVRQVGVRFDRPVQAGFYAIRHSENLQPPTALNGEATVLLNDRIAVANIEPLLDQWISYSFITAEGEVIPSNSSVQSEKELVAGKLYWWVMPDGGRDLLFFVGSHADYIKRSEFPKP